MPLSITFLDRTLMLFACCALRQDFRRFDLSRIGTAERTGQSYRPRRVPLLRDVPARLRTGATTA